MKTRKPWNLLAIVALLALLLPALAWAAYPAEVPRTGQTTCYDASGYKITCAGTGQDGEIQAGVAWPDPRFIDNADGTVTDKLTGLEWTKDANPAGGTKTWQAALDYVKTITIGSHTDWRLPNVNELESLVNAELYILALPQGHPFTNVQSDDYWSSTSDPNFPDSAYFVGMYHGEVFGYMKSNDIFVWPVRAGQCGSTGTSAICLPKTGQTTCYGSTGDLIDCSGTGQDGELQAGVAWLAPRFIDNGDGTVTDSLTGLEWTKDANPAGGYTTWQEALDCVKTLNTGSHSDWRLPNKNEQRSLADYARYSPALAQGHPFTNVQSYFYWSSTAYANDARNAWNLNMVNGYFDDGGKGVKRSYVWPVRAGQIGTPIISTTTTTAETTTTVISTTTVPSTTSSINTTTTTTACPATQVLGVDNPQLENLRSFRDSNLAQSAIGRKAINIYYANAGSINAAIDRSPALRAVARRVLEVIAPMVGREE